MVSSCSVRVHLLNGEGTNKWPFDNKCVLLGRHFGRTAFLESAKNVLNYLTWTRLRASLQIAFHAWFAFASIVLQDRIPILFFCWKKIIYIRTTYIKKSAMLATTTDLWKIKQMWHELWLLAEIIDIQCRMNNNEFIVFKVCLSYTYDRCNEVCTN